MTQWLERLLGVSDEGVDHLHCTSPIQIHAGRHGDRSFGETEKKTYCSMALVLSIAINAVIHRQVDASPYE